MKRVSNLGAAAFESDVPQWPLLFPRVDPETEDPLFSLAELAGYRTFPMFFLVMLFFGFGVGVRNIMRLTKTRTPPGS